MILNLKKKNKIILFLLFCFLNFLVIFYLYDDFSFLLHFLTKYFEKSYQLKFHIIFNYLISLFIFEDFNYKKKINYTYLIILIFSFLFGYQFSVYLNSIDKDSFITIFSTNKNEILFYLESLKFFFIFNKYNFFIFLNNILLVIISTTLFNKKILANFFNFKKRKFYLILFFTALIINNLIDAYSAFKLNSNIKNNFLEPVFDVSSNKQNNLQVILYVGESTTIMNMGVYGYFRNNTPYLSELDQQDKIIKLNNIFSNHTHTGPSLISSFSFVESIDEIKKIINDQIRYSVIEVLDKQNIKTSVFTYDDSDNLYKTIYKNADIFKNKNIGVLSNGEINNYYDDISYNLHLKNIIKNDKSKNLLIFHSYAGHGPYLKNIPDYFRNKIDDYFNKKNNKIIFGNNMASIQNVEGYDSAIKYIDFNIRNIINDIEESNFPKILIYFADHGESVYSGAGHDSSRYTHEMSRVPFFIFFNQAAKNKYNDLFDKYNDKSFKDNIATLSQLPSTILDLFGIKVTNSNFIVPNIITKKNIINFPILLRDNKKLLLSKEIDLAEELSDFQNEFYVKSNSINEAKICYHRSNTVGKILRANLISDCLESDVNYIKKANKLMVTHDKNSKNIYLNLEDYFKIVKTKFVWIDLKDKFDLGICELWSKNLKNVVSLKSKIYLEINVPEFKLNKNLIECAKKITSMHNIEFIINIHNLKEHCNSNKDCYERLLINLEKQLPNLNLSMSNEEFQKNYLFLIDKTYNIFLWSVEINNLDNILNLSKNIKFIAVDAYKDPNNL